MCPNNRALHIKKNRQTREIYLIYEAMARNQNMAKDSGAVKYLERPGFFVCCFNACILMWTSALHLKS